MVVNLVVLAGRLLQLACHPGRAMGIGAWQQQGRWQAPSLEALLGAAMAAALPEDEADNDAALSSYWQRLPALRRAMRLSWRCLGLWCALMLSWQLAAWLG